MYTIEKIKSAHSKVKSDADFSAYIKELITWRIISIYYRCGKPAYGLLWVK